MSDLRDMVGARGEGNVAAIQDLGGDGERVPVVTRAGAPAVIGEAALEGALRSGSVRMPEGSKVSVLTPKGAQVSVNAADVGVALSLGGRLEGQESVRAHFEQEERARRFGDRPVDAAILGGLRGATFGLSDLAWRGIGAADEAGGLREFNPGASIASEIGGGLAPALLSGGTSAAGSVARMTPVGQVARLGGRIAEAGLWQGGGRLAAGAGRAVTGAGAGLLEGAVFGAGQGLSTAALDDSPLNVEAALSSIAHGALEGGAVGAGIGALFGGVSGVLKAPRKVAVTSDEVARLAQAPRETWVDYWDVTPGPLGKTTVAREAVEGAADDAWDVSYFDRTPDAAHNEAVFGRDVRRWADEGPLGIREGYGRQAEWQVGGLKRRMRVEMEPAAGDPEALAKATRTVARRETAREAGRLGVGDLAAGALVGTVLGEDPMLAAAGGGVAGVLMRRMGRRAFAMDRILGGAPRAVMRRVGELADKVVAPAAKHGRRPATVTALAVLENVRFGPEPTKAPGTVRKTYGSKLQETANARAEELAAAMANQVGTRQRIRDGLAPIRLLSPKLADALEAKIMERLLYAYERMPKDPGIGSAFGGSRYRMSESEASRWARHLEGSQSVLASLVAAMEGRLTVQHVDALRTLYPESYREVQLAVAQRAAGKDLDYTTKHQLQTLLGINIDSSMRKERVDMIQAMHAAAATPNPEKRTADLSSIKAPPATNTQRQSERG